MLQVRVVVVLAPEPVVQLVVAIHHRRQRLVMAAAAAVLVQVNHQMIKIFYNVQNAVVPAPKWKPLSVPHVL